MSDHNHSSPDSNQTSSSEKVHKNTGWKQKLTQIRRWPWQDYVNKHRSQIYIFGGSAVILLLILIIGFSFSRSNDIVVDFEQAMIEEDKSKLKDLIESDHSSLEIDDSFLNQLIEQGKVDDDFLVETVMMMNAQKSVYKKKDLEAGDYSLSQEYLADKDMTEQELLNEGGIYLKKSEGWFGNRFVIGVRPHYMNLTSPIEPSQIRIDGKVVNTKVDEKEYLHGPILPGKFEVIATKKYPFATVTDKKDVNLFDEPNQKATVTFNLNGDYANFKSNIENTELFIDNQSTGTLLSSAPKKFGPVSTDGKRKAHGQFTFPFGTLKSTPVPIHEDLFRIDVTPNPMSNEKIKKEIIETINTYAKEFVLAKEKKDANQFTTLEEEEKKKWQNDFAKEKEYNDQKTYKGQALKTVINVDQVTLSTGNRGDVYKMKVPVQFHLKEREYGRLDSGDEPLKDETNNTYVWLMYNEDEKQWDISEINTLFFAGDMFKGKKAVTTEFDEK